MQDFEKLGLLYLGKIVNPSSGKTTDELFLYDAKDLTTHAVCVGMTGSGKTGLGIAILEELALDKIPAIVIDPKGDLGDLLLTFPHLSPEEFLPWVDEDEAERKALTRKEYAENVAKTWKEGLASWGESPERIQNLKQSSDMVIYTPGSQSGVPLSILNSFAAPSKEIVEDPAALRERIQTTTSSLLSLVGIDADPIKSREHILISTLIDRAWCQEKDLDLATLIQQIQKPPFDKVGILDLETFFPAKERLSLSVRLNNLLASPGFQAWMEGEPLDIQTLLYTPAGKPKISILSIAHLSDSERMFFVTLLLNELLSWTRRQTGTSSLRALFYMDEIFGYFPPTATPPSKLPMISLLKQARAFGLGIVLATQNPVDLDYKGLANCGSWFIGKLQTERDKARVLEGLSTASNGELNANLLNKMLAAVVSRVFILRSVHHKDPILFQTRWTMSYLKGPLTLAQIRTLTTKVPHKEKSATEKLQESNRPPLSTHIQEYFLAPANTNSSYKPSICGIAKLHFVDTKNKIDTWDEVCYVSPFDEEGNVVQWAEGEQLSGGKSQLERASPDDATFENLPGGLMQEKSYSIFGKTFSEFLYQTFTLTLFKAPDLRLISTERESEVDFRTRIGILLQQKNEEHIQKLQASYAEKKGVITERLKRAQNKVTEQQQKKGWRIVETIISFLTTTLGAIFSGKLTKGTISQAGTSIMRAGRIGKDTQGATLAEESVQEYQRQLDELEDQLQGDLRSLEINRIEPTIEKIPIRPRKSDISIEEIALVWTPTKK